MPIVTYSEIPGEIWKPVPGFAARYEASSEGRIRVVWGKRCKNGPRLLRTFAGDGGYVRTAVMRDGKCYKPGVHQLIAAAFLGSCPDGYEVNHIDLDKTNNRPDNLEYLTHADNLGHARARRGNWSRSRRPLTQLSLWKD